MNWGFRGKVILASIIPALVMGVIISFTLISYQIKDLHHAFKHSAQTTTSMIANEMGHLIYQEDIRGINDTISLHLSQHNLSAIIIRNHKNQILAKSGLIPQTDDDKYYNVTSLVKSPSSVEGADSYVSTIPGIRQNHIIGSIYAYYSKQSLKHQQSDIIYNAFIVICLGLLISALLSLAFQKSAIRSVNNLKQAIHHISQGRFDTRIESHSDDEIGILEKEINDMTAVLEEIQDDMQNKVNESTSQLQESLEEIELKNEALERANAKAQEASRLKSDFMANMSHEIRTPMNGIIGFSNLLLKSKLTNEQAEYTQTIKSSASSLLAIINDILDFSKIESGDFTVENTDINLREVIEEVVTYMAPSAYEKGLEILFMYYSDVPENLVSDPVRVRQVISNLIGNAIKFTKTGQVIVRAMLEDEEQDTCTVRISIQDTGVGLSLKNQRKLFTAFSQADTTATREFGGTGLGLVISKKIAEKMDGTIDLDSKLAIGSTFWFEFNCQKQSGRIIMQPQDALMGMRCLIYDFNDNARNAILQHMRSWNMDITETDQAEEVANTVNQARNDNRPFQFIILGLSNLELDQQALKDIMEKIVDEHHYAFVTLVNNTEKHAYDNCFKLGADACLPKSARKKDLYQALCGLSSDHFNLAIQVQADKRELASAPYDLSSLKILVVDDNRINRKLVSTLLQQAYAQVYEATNGQEALDFAQLYDFDLIFMDIHMPIMNGIESTQLIRTTEQTDRRTPIIALTANAVTGERERLIDSGLDGCLIKPLQEQDIWSIMVKWVDGNKLKPMQYNKTTPEQTPVKTTDTISYTQHILENVDSQKAIEFAGGNEQLANELYNMFIEDLPSMKEKLINAYETSDHSQLEEEAHRIHGAASCCAVYQIKDAAQNLEKATIRNKTDEIPQYYEDLLSTIDEVLESQVT